MGLRVLTTLFITLIGIPMSFYNAFYGLITYAFWSYAFPEKATWGLLPIGRLSYVVGLVLVATTFMQTKRFFANNRKVLLIIIFWAFCLISVFTSGPTEVASWQFRFFTRIIIITLIMTLLIDDKKKFRYYLWTIAIFIGFIAAQSGIRGTLKGEIGGATHGFGGLIGDRNFMAVLLCVAIPIVFYMGNAEKNKGLRLLLRFILFGDILALILTYARAGFLGMVAIGFFIFLKSKNKILIGLLGTALVFILVSFFVPQEYIDRLYTMKKYDIQEEDADVSAAGRIVIWRSTLELIKDKPLFGAGFYNSEKRIGRYPDPVTGMQPWGRAIHNTILQVAADTGIIALFVFILVFFTAYRTLGRIRRRAIMHNLTREYGEYAAMLQVAFVGYFSCGFFVNGAFLDLPWHLVGLTIALEEIVKKEVRTGEKNLNASQ